MITAKAIDFLPWKTARAPWRILARHWRRLASILMAYVLFPCEGKGVLHLLVEDALGARRALIEGCMQVAGER